MNFIQILFLINPETIKVFIVYGTVKQKEMLQRQALLQGQERRRLMETFVVAVEAFLENAEY